MLRFGGGNARTVNCAPLALQVTDTHCQVTANWNHSGSCSWEKPSQAPAANCCPTAPDPLKPRLQGWKESRYSGASEAHVLCCAAVLLCWPSAGSRELGIPTANLDPESLQGQLAEAVTGIYGGWASVGESGAVYKMAMSIGWNPVFANKVGERRGSPSQFQKCMRHLGV